MADLNGIYSSKCDFNFRLNYIKATTTEAKAELQVHNKGPSICIGLLFYQAGEMR
jgi:hypothetical protein